MGEQNTWKLRALFAEMAHRWNTTIQSGKPAPGQRANMEFARSWYMHHRHLKPGEAAKEIRKGIERHFPNPDGHEPEVRTIIKWIKDLAPADVSGRGRPFKK